MKSKEIYTEARRKEVYGKYSPELDKCIDALRCAEGEEKLKVGEWHIGLSSPALYLGNKKGVYLDGSEVRMANPKHWQPTDMSKVKDLLIKEAEKKEFKEGVKFRVDGIDYDWTFHGLPSFHELQGTNLYGSNYEGCIFNSKTGKWAEIVEEKKPLYTNHTKNKTEFFEGDKFYRVNRVKLEIRGPFTLEVLEGSQYGGFKKYTEIMTKQECYQYLADNCKE